MVDPPLFSQEDLFALLRDVKTWNQMRLAHPGFIPELSGIELKGFCLAGVNFSKVRMLNVHLDGANLIASNWKGAVVENVNFDSAQLERTDFRQSELKNSKFIGSSLDSTVFGNASLECVKFEKTSILNSSFKSADLYRVSFRDSIIDTTNFEKSTLHIVLFQSCNIENSRFKNAGFRSLDLLGSNLRQCDFWNCDLSLVQNLQEGHLAAADLAYSTLPNDFQFTGLKSVEETSKRAQAILYTLILACGFVLFSIMGVKDQQIILNSEKIQLPLIQVGVPIRLFSVFAPLIVTCIFVYFHVYLAYVWRVLSGLPAYFPDGMALGEKVYPWIMNGVTVKYFSFLSGGKLPYRQIRGFGRTFFGWALALLVQFVFFLFFLKLHSWLVTIIHLVYISLSLMFVFYSVSRRDKMFRRTFFIEKVWRGSAAIFDKLLKLGLHEKPPKKGGFIIVLVLSSCLFFAFLILESGDRCHYKYFDIDLVGEKLVKRPDNWKQEDSSKLSEKIEVLNLSNANFNYARFSNVFFAKAVLDDSKMNGFSVDDSDFYGASMKSAQMSKANIEKCNFESVHLNCADMTYVKMSEVKFPKATLTDVIFDYATVDLRDRDKFGACFMGAMMNGVKFRFSDLEEVNFQDADLSSADFYGAKIKKSVFSPTVKTGKDPNGTKDTVMTGTRFVLSTLEDVEINSVDLNSIDFSGATMTRVNLVDTWLIEANFQGSLLILCNFRDARLIKAEMEGSDLKHVSFQDADLRGAKLQGANLKFVSFREADLREAKLQGAKMLHTDLKGARLEGANLEGVSFLTAEQLNDACFDTTTILPDHLFEQYEYALTPSP